MSILWWLAHVYTTCNQRILLVPMVTSNLGSFELWSLFMYKNFLIPSCSYTFIGMTMHMNTHVCLIFLVISSTWSFKFNLISQGVGFCIRLASGFGFTIWGGGVFEHISRLFKKRSKLFFPKTLIWRWTKKIVKEKQKK